MQNQIVPSFHLLPHKAKQFLPTAPKRNPHLVMQMRKAMTYAGLPAGRHAGPTFGVESD